MERYCVGKISWKFSASFSYSFPLKSLPELCIFVFGVKNILFEILPCIQKICGSLKLRFSLVKSIKIPYNGQIIFRRKVSDDSELTSEHSTMVWLSRKTSKVGRLQFFNSTTSHQNPRRNLITKKGFEKFAYKWEFCHKTFETKQGKGGHTSRAHRGKNTLKHLQLSFLICRIYCI